ncbi:MAG: right-handed parallel beta-helix repeat-containing protein [Phycisphaerales bacterium]|nr:right-handed parallel beta-helix repeat-containing protein [Phycisphaerales bacterium]
MSVRSGICVLLVSLPALAGDLDPPPGPVQPTMKTLDAVEPRRAIESLLFAITEPGSWYLTRGVTLDGPGDALTIHAPGVVLDLNGFALDGAHLAGRAIAITSDGPVTIRNGIIRGFIDGGIHAPAAAQALIEDLHLVDNGGTGLDIAGGVVRRCTFEGNDVGLTWDDGIVISACVARRNGTGFQGGSGAALSHCTAIDNGLAERTAAPPRGGPAGAGFHLGDDCTLTACVSRGNGSYGIAGGTGVTLQHCSASGNGAVDANPGIFLGDAAVVSDTTASNNTGNGIEAENGAVITQCSAVGNMGEGILTADASTIRGCTARDNSGTGIITGDIALVAECAAFNNGDEGIAINASSKAHSCTVQENGRHGIFTSIYCEVRDCNVIRSAQHGIFTQSNCYIFGNNCQANGTIFVGEGIHLVGSNSRVEGNHCTANDVGIRVQFAGNYVFRNTCQGNSVLPESQYQIDAGNTVGTLIESPTDPALNAWSNFTDLP